MIYFNFLSAGVCGVTRENPKPVEHDWTGFGFSSRACQIPHAGTSDEHAPSTVQNPITAGHAWPGGQGIAQESPHALPSQGSSTSWQTGVAVEQVPLASQYSRTSGQTPPFSSGS